MMKKLLFCLFTLFAFVSFTHAQDDIAGKYNGELTVSFGNTKMNAVIFIEKQEDGKYTLSVKDFIFQQINIGNLDITDVVRSEEGGIILLSKEGSSTGPTVEVSGSLNTHIYLDGATIANENLELDLVVNGSSEFVPEEQFITNVSFVGDKQPTALGISKENTINIYTSNDIITVEGLISGDYDIYNYNGAKIQSGKIANGKITINSLPEGSYILRVDDKTAKFIK